MIVFCIAELKHYLNISSSVILLSVVVLSVAVLSVVVLSVVVLSVVVLSVVVLSVVVLIVVVLIAVAPLSLSLSLSLFLSALTFFKLMPKDKKRILNYFFEATISWPKLIKLFGAKFLILTG